ncbi:MAG: cytochrome c3 family protein, partial [Verrucomicrobiales bacterium]
GLDLPAVDHAITLGIACEACHNGCADHVKDEDVVPSFFPKSPHVVVEGTSNEEVWGHNAINVNWACSRCHSGGRKTYAGGISTWNSTELSDAARGGCYDPVAARETGMTHLTCVTCHNPHEGIGQQWPRTRAEDNKSCVDCHSQFKNEETLVSHTHHPAASTGSDCMNCHMPRINEGLQDMVRTHTIFSPTEPRMIEANQPNACNQCHVEEGIDWTLGYLKEWYGADGFDRSRIDLNYPGRAESAALGWLRSPHSGTRLVGSDSLTRAKASWALPDLIGMLDDDHLINRQFTARGLEKMLGRNLRDLGYRFYMFRDEREEPLQRIREELLEQADE